MTTKHLVANNSARPFQVRRIGIFIYPGADILDIAGPSEVFAFANLMLLLQGVTKEPAYIVDILAEQPGVVTTLMGLQIIATHGYNDMSDDIDTLIIAGGFVPAGFFPGIDVGNPSTFKNPVLMAWIRTMSTRVRRLASVCTGAFALAESGILNGRRATTHWDFCQRLMLDYPDVKVEPNQIFIQEGNIFTSGGITSGIDLALTMLEEDWGHDIALAVARYIVVFLKRPGGQSQFSSYLTTEAASRPDLRELQTWIMAHPAEDLRVEVLASRVCMSPRNFARLFLAETGMTPAKYVEMARIDAARHYLQTSKLSIEMIAEKSGFFDPERMRRSFIRQLGVNPKHYRDRFNP
ncbi:MAG: AraC family transcriptional regulator [Methylococcaceae bacterium NSP1-2]|nr:MAG: AraC family transcriptional regulator [Methylococcaceae bacterium NSP1-2]